MNAIRIRTHISQGHELVLRNLPLAEGKKVEVIILEDDNDSDISLSTRERFPLRGKTIRYEHPFDSATDETDWEAAK